MTFGIGTDVPSRPEFEARGLDVPTGGPAW